MAATGNDVLEVLSILELAEQEKRKTGTGYAVKQAAQRALQFARQTGENGSVHSEIEQRANRLLDV